MSSIVIMEECQAEKSQTSTGSWWVLTKKGGECEMRSWQKYMFIGLENDVILVDIYFLTFETLLIHQEIVGRCNWEFFLGKKLLCHGQEQKI